jgi:hypothetical protein
MNLVRVKHGDYYEPMCETCGALVLDDELHAKWHETVESSIHPTLRPK